MRRRAWDFSVEARITFLLWPKRNPQPLLELIARLQELATVPMIDIRAYAEWLEK